MKKGILLYAKSPSITIQGLKLEHYTLIVFSLENLNAKEKVKVKRLLYGHKTKKIVKEKLYESEEPGLVRKLGGLRTGAGAVTVPKENLSTLEEELEKRRVKFKEIDIWLTPDSIQRLKLLPPQPGEKNLKRGNLS